MMGVSENSKEWLSVWYLGEPMYITNNKIGLLPYVNSVASNPNNNHRQKSLKFNIRY